MRINSEKLVATVKHLRSLLGRFQFEGPKRLISRGIGRSGSRRSVLRQKAKIIIFPKKKEPYDLVATLTQQCLLEKGILTVSVTAV